MGGGTYDSKLSYWLYPGTTTLNGMDANCNSIDVFGIRPPSNKIKERVVCKVINVENTTVQSGKTLELQANESVKIYGGFKVEAGAGFSIK